MCYDGPKLGPFSLERAMQLELFPEADIGTAPFLTPSDSGC